MHAISEMLENGHFLTNSLIIVCKNSVHGNNTVVICRDGMKCKIFCVLCVLLFLFVSVFA